MERTTEKQDRKIQTPFDLWFKLYEEGERSFTATLEKVAGTSAFAEATGKTLETILASQRVVREGVRACMEAFNLPTREDVARLGELITGLEEKVDRLDDRLGRGEQAGRHKGKEG